MSETMTEQPAGPEGIEEGGEADARAEAFIICEVAGALYAIPSRDIGHLEMVSSITPVPNAPAFVEGVVSARGQVIPVVNLRARFGFPKLETTLRSRLVVVCSGGRSVALLVDTAREFAAIPAAAIQRPPDDIAGTSGDYIEGMAELGARLVLILRTTHLLKIEVDPEAINPPSGPEGQED